jgi:hypothetical protein
VWVVKNGIGMAHHIHSFSVFAQHLYPSLYSDQLCSVSLLLARCVLDAVPPPLVLTFFFVVVAWLIKFIQSRSRLLRSIHRAQLLQIIPVKIDENEAQNVCVCGLDGILMAMGISTHTHAR